MQFKAKYTTIIQHKEPYYYYRTIPADSVHEATKLANRYTHKNAKLLTITQTIGKD